MDEYVAKPIRQERLFQAIANAIGIEQVDTASSGYVPSSGILQSGSSSGILQSGSSPKLVNWIGPLGRLSGDHAALKDITESYIEETRENLSCLPAAIAAGNADESKRLAHTVKGSMRFFRAETATQCGLDLERLAGTGNLTSAPELIERLNSEAERVLAVLQHFVETGEM